MSTTTKTLYETDFVEWADTTAALLRAGRFSEIDMENVAEEIESLGRSDRRTVRSQLERLLMHLLKQRIQPQKDGPSWRASIGDARSEILRYIEDSPSLKRYLSGVLEEEYRRAVKRALSETGLYDSPQAKNAIPDRCPWTLHDLLDGDFAGLVQR